MAAVVGVKLRSVSSRLFFFSIPPCSICVDFVHALVEVAQLLVLRFLLFDSSNKLSGVFYFLDNFKYIH